MKEEEKNEVKLEEHGDDGDLLGHYLRDIGKHKLLSAEEEQELAKRVSEGDEAARREFIESNLRLVVSIAKKYKGYGLSLDDLIQEGNIGLMNAVKRYDYTRGFRLSTYAIYWIKQAITRAIANSSHTIKLPVHVNEAIFKVNRAEQELEQRLGRAPTLEEVSEHTEIPLEKLNRIKTVGRASVSLDAPIGEDGDGDMGDVLADMNAKTPQELYETAEVSAQLAAVLGTLSPREQIVILLRYGLADGVSRTLEDVGLMFGVTRERIRQIECKALRKLRSPKRANRIAR